VAALVRVPPVYPPGARRAGIEGTVTVELAVRPDGSVGEVRVIDASPAGVFEGAVLRALRQWRFGAAGGEGDPALRHARQVVRFSLRS
jgi:protein TonB